MLCEQGVMAKKLSDFRERQGTNESETRPAEVGDEEAIASLAVRSFSLLTVIFE
jgi:hypothetical protein